METLSPCNLTPLGRLSAWADFEPPCNFLFRRFFFIQSQSGMRRGLEGPEGSESGVTAQSVGITAANSPDASMTSAAFNDVTNGAQEPRKRARRPATLVASV
jgi:hypothetical protein